MVYDPNLPSLSSLGTEALFAWNQDAINEDWNAKANGSLVPLMTTVSVGTNSNISINATMMVPPTVIIPFSKGPASMIQLMLNNFMAPSTLTLPGEPSTTIDLTSGDPTSGDGWTIVLQGPLTMDHATTTPDTSGIWTIHPGSNSADLAGFSVISAYAGGASPSIDAQIQKDLDSVTLLMAKVWDSFSVSPDYTLATFSWPYISLPLMNYVAWKTAADAELEGSNDGIDRPLDPRFSKYSPNGAYQLVISGQDGTTIPAPKNYVPLGSNGVFMISCSRFLIDQLQTAIFNAQPKRGLAEHQGKEVGPRTTWPTTFLLHLLPDIPGVDYTTIGPAKAPVWTFLPFDSVEEPTYDLLAELTHEIKAYSNTTQIDKPPEIGLDMKMIARYTCTKKTGITYVGTVVITPPSGSNLSAPPTCNPIVDLDFDGIDEQGRLTFLPSGSLNVQTPIPNGPLSIEWGVPNAAMVARWSGLSATLWNVGLIQTAPLPGSQHYLLSNPTISTATFDFSVSLSLNLQAQS